jgi:[calcium/calmodulin-dependent protein kinase] kinase
MYVCSDKYLFLKSILKDKYNISNIKDAIININDFDRDKLLLLCINLCNEIYNEDENEKSTLLNEANRRNSSKSKNNSALSISSSDTFNSVSIDSKEHEEIITTTIINKSKSDEGYPKLNNYIIIEKIGAGSYGKVYLAYNKKNGKKFAIKVINKCKTLYINEINILKKINHKNIVNLHEIIDCEFENQIYVVLNHINGNTIMQKNTNDSYFKMSKIKIKKYIRYITAGLKYLHNHNIVHRDIKPENLMIDKKDNVYIIDFGISEILNETTMTSKKSGTLLFAPPELFSDENEINGFAIDIWSLGVTLFIMLYGYFPFNGDSFDEISNSIKNDAIFIPSDADAFEIDIINKILEKDPKKRITLSEIRKHPFMTNE